MDDTTDASGAGLEGGGTPPGGGAPEPFDDDRLLSYALGLQPDAELETALDDELRARLEAVRADVAAVERGLERVVPVPAEDYADLGRERWAGLAPFLRTPAAAPARRRSWLRVLAPVAAVALVLAAGVVAVQYVGGNGERAMTAGDDAGGQKALSERAPALSGGGESPSGADTSGSATARQDAAGYRLVVVATARPPDGARQAFSVDRALKGHAPSTLVLRVGDRAVTPDALVVLYLLPVRIHADATPAPAPTGYAATQPRPTYRGRPALVRQLPAGTDPATVTLP